jgi:hypothetical protein
MAAKVADLAAQLAQAQAEQAAATPNASAVELQIAHLEALQVDDRGVGAFGGFPPRAPQRYTGGEQRIQPRTADYERRFVDQGLSTAAQASRMHAALTLGAKVTPSSIAAAVSVVSGVSGGASYRQRMIQLGALPRPSQDAPVTAGSLVGAMLAREAKLSAGDAVNKLKTFKTSNELWRFVFKNKLNTFMAGDDPVEFEALQFHYRCVQSIELEYAFDVAHEYYQTVLQGWIDDHIDLVELSQSRAATLGAIKAALHVGCFTNARLTAMEAKTKGGGGGGAGGGGGGGGGGSGTWCSTCGRMYPKAAKHDASSCAKTAKEQWIKEHPNG